MTKKNPQPVSLTAIFKWYLLLALIAGALVVAGGIMFYFIAGEDAIPSVKSLSGLFTTDFFIYLLVGFIAQLIDGALGMAYGVSSSSFLMAFGVSPAVASASVHFAEVFTTGLSGLSHWKFGNVDAGMFKKLAIPGAVGAALGAYVIVTFDGNAIKPYIAAYLLIMGLIIIFKAFKTVTAFKDFRKVRGLALFGGFVDASGGGGWGPVVTSTLIASGNNPKLTIGTVNAVEFFVAFTASGIFTMLIGIDSWRVIAGLIAGGAIAAPVGAYICNKVNTRTAMIMVGLLIVFLSARTIVNAF